MATLNLTLLQNSHAFINEALARAIKAEGNPHEWQFAILALVQAIELALKERLRREHAILIFKNIDQRKQTVTLQQAVVRLTAISGVNFTESDLSAIRTASQWRNLVVHYQFEFSTEMIKPVFARLLGFLVEFYKNHLDLSLSEHVSADNWMEAVAITDFGNELFQRATVRFQKESIDSEFIWDCPSCGNGAFIIQDHFDTCYVCGYADSVVECDSCGDFLFQDDCHEIDTLSSHDIRQTKFLCRHCYEEIRRINDDHYEDPYY